MLAATRGLGVEALQRELAPSLQALTRVLPVRKTTVWWAKYCVNGRVVRESTGTEKRTEAQRFLKAREGRVATGQPVLPRVDRIRYEEIAADLRQHYETTGERGLAEADARLKRLKTVFAGRRVAAIGAADVTAYVAARQAEAVANGTINRELAVSDACCGWRTRTENSCGCLSSAS